MITMVLALGLVIFFVVYPAFLILLNSFNTAPVGQASRYGLGEWLQAFSTPALPMALANTCKLFLVRQGIAFPVGVFIAWLLARTNIPFRYGFEFLFWLSFFLPTLLVATGWTLLLDPNLGILNQLLKGWFSLDRGPFNIFSFWGIVWTHLMANSISIKVMLLTPAFRNMDASFEEASWTAGSSTLGTLLRITLPLMTPVLIVIALLSTLRVFESYEIELLLGVPFDFYVYSTQIVALVRDEPPLYGQASALGSLTLLLLVGLVFMQRRLITRRSYATLSGRFKPALINLGPWRPWTFGCVLITTAFLTVVPVVATLAASFMTRFGYFHLAQAWTLDHWRLALGDSTFLLSLQNTLLVAVISAVAAPFVFSLLAYLIVRSALAGRGALDTMTWLPQAIPGVLTSLGLLWLFLESPFLKPFYGTHGALVLALVLGHVTTSTQIIKASFLQLGTELEEASRLSGAGWWKTYFKIVLPLMAPTLVLIGILHFIWAAQNASTVVLLASHNTRTLALLTLDFFAEGLREAAAVNTIVIVVLTTGVALLARFFGLRMGIRQ
ncbi:MAG TPA: iron ABC transporter permease [Candidatus Binatia bacterium]